MHSITSQNPIRSITVLGGGSAGFIAALTLKRKRPHLRIRVLRSPHLGIIGVGEGTTPYFPAHFHGYLGLKPDRFYSEVQPIWKLGIHYLWGPRPSFNYTFTPQTDFRYPDLSKNNGFYCEQDFTQIDRASALMAADRVFPRQPNGDPLVAGPYAYHMENKKLVSYLEARARDFGVEIHDATVTSIKRDESGGVASLALDDGTTEAADLFVDASGFYAELLGKTLEEPFLDYKDALFCDRAVVGGWSREETEPIQPYTTAETMGSGWCWCIDHEEIINRGYVFSSNHLSDGAAEAEFRQKNPRLGNTRIVKFRSGRYQRNWVHNVVGMGNASGFVEPLEATALMCICLQSRALADGLMDNDDCPTPSMKSMFNQYLGGLWDEIRDFLSVHYKFNTRLDTPFWNRCRTETALHGASRLVEYYQENGPSVLARDVLMEPNSPFGIEGYYTMLVGMKVPHARPFKVPPAEHSRWENHRRRNQQGANKALDVRQALAAIRGPKWKWT
jgi:tryptophan halogenase